MMISWLRNKKLLADDACLRETRRERSKRSGAEAAFAQRCICCGGSCVSLHTTGCWFESSRNLSDSEERHELRAILVGRRTNYCRVWSLGVRCSRRFFSVLAARLSHPELGTSLFDAEETPSRCFFQIAGAVCSLNRRVCCTGGSSGSWYVGASFRFCRAPCSSLFIILITIIVLFDGVVPEESLRGAAKRKKRR